MGIMLKGKSASMSRGPKLDGFSGPPKARAKSKAEERRAMRRREARAWKAERY